MSNDASGTRRSSRKKHPDYEFSGQSNNVVRQRWQLARKALRCRLNLIKREYTTQCILLQDAFLVHTGTCIIIYIYFLHDYMFLASTWLSGTAGNLTPWWRSNGFTANGRRRCVADGRKWCVVDGRRCVADGHSRLHSGEPLAMVAVKRVHSQRSSRAGTSS